MHGHHVEKDAQDQSIQDAAMDPFAHLPGFLPDRRDDTPAFCTNASLRQDVVDELAYEYLMTVTNASAMHGHQAATGTLPALPGTTQAFPMVLELEKEMPAHFSLEDVLSGQLSIEQVLTGIGADHAHRDGACWDQPEAVKDVLMLFADGLACPAQSRLPDLTRREHHAISPDSHVAMGHIADAPAGLSSTNKTTPDEALR